MYVKNDLEKLCVYRGLAKTGNKADLLLRLRAQDRYEEWYERDLIQRKNTDNIKLREIQMIEQDLYDLDECLQNLIEYRSHLCRHKSEDSYAKRIIDNLQDDETYITSDYKMKILPMAFQENQKKFFGNKGKT